MTKKVSGVITSDRKGSVVSRLYAEATAKQKRLAKKQNELAWTPEDTFQPDISRSQSHCESSSLQGARHEALFMAVSSESTILKKEYFQDILILLLFCRELNITLSGGSS